MQLVGGCFAYHQAANWISARAEAQRRQRPRRTKLGINSRIAQLTYNKHGYKSIELFLG
jgi:hypothetical protein